MSCSSTAGAAPCLCPGDTPPCPLCLRCPVQVPIPAVDWWTGRCPGLNVLQLLGAPCAWSVKALPRKMSRILRAAVSTQLCTGGHCRRRSRWCTVHRSDQRSLFPSATDTPRPVLFPGISPLTPSIPKHTESAGGCREVRCCDPPHAFTQHIDTNLTVNKQGQDVRTCSIDGYNER